MRREYTLYSDNPSPYTSPEDMEFKEQWRGLWCESRYVNDIILIGVQELLHADRLDEAVEVIKSIRYDMTENIHERDAYHMVMSSYARARGTTAARELIDTIVVRPEHMGCSEKFSSVQQRSYYDSMVAGTAMEALRQDDGVTAEILVDRLSDLWGETGFLRLLERYEQSDPEVFAAGMELIARRREK